MLINLFMSINRRERLKELFPRDKKSYHGIITPWYCLSFLAKVIVQYITPLSASIRERLYL